MQNNGDGQVKKSFLVIAGLLVILMLVIQTLAGDSYKWHSYKKLKKHWKILTLSVTK